MKKIYFNLSLILSVFLLTFCTKDLDVTPLDKDVVVSDNLGDREGALIQTLAKLYASFALPGQTGTTESDIANIDPGFGTYTRALWMLQTLTTDEALCAWNDQTIKDYHWHSWSAQDVFNTAMYSRIIYVATICNEFIRNTAGNDDAEVKKYNAEARFLRALAYFHGIDMYGNPAFITEKDLPSTSFFPPQTTRADLFNYVESELLDIQDKMGDPRFEYGRADKAAVWMLLSRLYLNAEVYIGQPKFTECLTYTNKLINEGGYTLDPFYNRIFAANNHESPEMIFAFNYDGQYSHNYGGTTYIIHAATGPMMMSPAKLGIGSGWGGNRTTKEFVNVLVDTLLYPPTSDDTLYTKCPDKRVKLNLLGNWDIYNVGTFTDGIGVWKYSNMTHDGQPAEHPHGDFVCTDYPVFRLAEAYLNYAEAVLRGGSGGDLNTALTLINQLRERAYGNQDGNIEASDLTLDFILKERGKELYWEGHRRTDLIRYNLFTTADYVWAWKGNTMAGRATDSFRNLFPIPASETASNPNIKQNIGY